MKVRWIGPIPTTCETCYNKLTNKFYDAKTTMGPWACMCPTCFNLGPGIGKLGQGFGQEYTKKKEGDNVIWEKTGG